MPSFCLRGALGFQKCIEDHIQWSPKHWPCHGPLLLSHSIDRTEPKTRNLKSEPIQPVPSYLASEELVSGGFGGSAVPAVGLSSFFGSSFFGSSFFSTRS
jgi:hypothetical protein